MGTGTVGKGALIILLACLLQFFSPVWVRAEDSQEAGQASGVELQVTNDAHIDKQWALGRLQDLLVGVVAGDEVLVAVLDTGVDVRHEDLEGKVVASVNFSDSPTVLDLCGHGTHVAGIIAAITNNGVGIAGAAPNARLLNVKVADDNGMVWASAVAKGIVWAVDNGARVINLSFTIPATSESLREAIRYARAHDVVLVAAAGNYIASPYVYPACYPEVTSVGALNPDGTLWEGSNHGDWVAVYAPGAEILSTLPGNGYGYESGTSMAAAYVSAVAALAFNMVTDADGDGRYSGEVTELVRAVFGQR